MPVKFSRRADQDIIDIYLYSEERFGETQAERFRIELFAACASLEKYPNAGRDAPTVSRGLGIFVHAGYAIAYRSINSDTVIVRVLHTSTDWLRHLTE